MVSVTCPMCDGPLTDSGRPDGADFLAEDVRWCGTCVRLCDAMESGDKAAEREWQIRIGSLTPELVAPWQPLPAQAPTPSPPSIAGQILDYEGLMALPDPEPLIDDVLDLDSATWIIGQPGSYKSFFALDWSCHVATGRNWRGKAVRKGPVLYVCAEGTRGIRKRAAAWTKKHGEVPQDLRVLPVPVQSVEAGAYGRLSFTSAWREVIDAAKQLGAILIVLDTQARLTEGLNENDAGEMAFWVKAVDAVKVATGGCVLVVHHTTKQGDTERGSSAIRGAADRTWMVRKSGMGALLSSEKSKDSGDSEMFSVDMEKVDLGVDAKGRPLDSLVLGADKEDRFAPKGDALTAMKDRDRVAALNETRRWIVMTLLSIDEPTTEFAKGGATQSALLRSIDEGRKAAGLATMPKSTFYGAVKQLLEPFPGDDKPILFKVPGTQRLTMQDPDDSPLLAGLSLSGTRTERTISSETRKAFPDLGLAMTSPFD